MYPKLRRPSPAFVIALVALFVALGGTAVAAAPFIAVGSPAGGDLADTYPNPTIAADAVESAEVVNGSLRSDDFVVASGVLSTAESLTLQPGECNGPGRGIDGLRTTDFVSVAANAPLPDGVFVRGHVFIANMPIVELDHCNFSPATITVPMNTYRFIVIR